MSEVGRVVELRIPTDRETGKPRGFAFVTFGNAEEAGAAIEHFDGRELGGRALRVNRAEERRSRPQRAPRPQSPRAEEEDSFDRFDTRGDSDWTSDRFRPKSKGSRKGARGKKRSL